MNGNKLLRVLIADDHRMLREALCLVLEPECEIVGEAASGEDAVAIAIKTRPDVILLDLSMPGIGGLEAARQLAKRMPSAKILILSQYEDDEYVIDALGEARVAGYLTKAAAAAEVLQAVRAVHGGKRYLSAAVMPAVLNRLKPSGKPSPVSLTARERQVLKLVGEGATSKTIASRLGISPKTAQIHRTNLMVKLGVHSTAAVVRYAIQHKLVRS